MPGAGDEREVLCHVRTVVVVSGSLVDNLADETVRGFMQRVMGVEETARAYGRLPCAFKAQQALG